MVPVLDAILSLVVVEALILALYNRTTGRGIRPARYLPNLAAGYFLLLAARCALAEAPVWALPACLLVSLCAHVADLVGRWDRP